uniref:Uncharacterized protein LOC114339959 n=1 Tax=Diabrotica virgifera virgifera TaxID=50390 RepID=A0A6P7GKG6_DIAVI
MNLALQTIIQILDDLQTAITFAKIKTLHNGLIKPDEIRWTIQKMLEHHPASQLPYLQEEDLMKYYEIVEVDGYYSNHSLVFILHFPILHSKVFTYFHLYSLPTINNTIIIPPGPSLVSNSELFQYMDLPCRKSEPKKFICPEKFPQENTETDDCINQILKLSNDAAQCQNVPITISTTIIQKLSEAHYIAVFPKATKISTHCSTSKIEVLEGTFLIELPPGCEFRTNNEVYINSKAAVKEEPLTLPKIKIKFQDEDPTVKPLKLDRIQLDELHKLSTEEERLQPVSLTTMDHSHLWTPPIYFLVIALIILLVYKLRELWKKKKMEEDEEEEDAADPEPTPSVLSSLTKLLKGWRNYGAITPEVSDRNQQFYLLYSAF